MCKYNMTSVKMVKHGNKWIVSHEKNVIVSQLVKNGFINGIVKQSFKVVGLRLVQRGKFFTIYGKDYKIEVIFTIHVEEVNEIDSQLPCKVQRKDVLSIVKDRIRAIRKANVNLCNSVKVSKSLMTEHLRAEIIAVRQATVIQNQILNYH